MSSHSSVDRAPARCRGGRGFDSCRGLGFFLSPNLVSRVDQFTFHISLPGLKIHHVTHLSSFITHDSVELL